jgi:hypothetical protein
VGGTAAVPQEAIVLHCGHCDAIHMVLPSMQALHYSVFHMYVLFAGAYPYMHLPDAGAWIWVGQRAAGQGWASEGLQQLRMTQ